MGSIRQRGSLIALLMAVAVVGGGCSSTPTAEPVSEGAKGTVKSTSEGGPIKKEVSGGAQPDTNVYAAPSGVKTGVEGGRK